MLHTPSMAVFFPFSISFSQLLEENIRLIPILSLQSPSEFSALLSLYTKMQVFYVLLLMLFFVASTSWILLLDPSQDQ